VVAWNWVSAQLEDGTDVSVYDLVHSQTKASQGRWAIVVDADGTSRSFRDFTLTPQAGRGAACAPSRSTPLVRPGDPRRGPVALGGRGVRRPGAGDGDQQARLLGGPLPGEGHPHGPGGAGPGLRGAQRLLHRETLDGFFKSVGEAVRESVQEVYPLELSRSHAEKLVAAPGRESVLDGVDLKQLARTLIAPVREITDRGGKAWRSYAALACCDVVLGDSRKFAEWLAFPEFMHVGSLIVDDVQDKSDVRRGGPTVHLTWGEGLAINAGTAAYFMGERMLRRSLVPDAVKLELYDLYFEALREGHAGQAIDLDGLEAFVPAALDGGDIVALEQRVLAIHRLKTAAPASALARMGALVGGGSRVQWTRWALLPTPWARVPDRRRRAQPARLQGRAQADRRGHHPRQGDPPVARALGTLSATERRHLWVLVSLRSADPAVVARPSRSSSSAGPRRLPARRAEAGGGRLGRADPAGGGFAGQGDVAGVRLVRAGAPLLKDAETRAWYVRRHEPPLLDDAAAAPAPRGRAGRPRRRAPVARWSKIWIRPSGSAERKYVEVDLAAKPKIEVTAKTSSTRARR